MPPIGVTDWCVHLGHNLLPQNTEIAPTVGLRDMLKKTSYELLVIIRVFAGIPSYIVDALSIPCIPDYGVQRGIFMLE